LKNFISEDKVTIRSFFFDVFIVLPCLYGGSSFGESRAVFINLSGYLLKGSLATGQGCMGMSFSHLAYTDRAYSHLWAYILLLLPCSLYSGKCRKVGSGTNVLADKYLVVPL